MPTASKGAIAACSVISALSLFVWVVLLATLSELGHSDPAGNGLAEAFAGLEIILLWALLGILLLVSGVAGRMPWSAVLAAAILLPASGYAAVVALGLLADHDAPPYLWPIVTPALVPPILVALSFWTLLPALRATIPAHVALAVAWGTTLVFCIVPWPMAQFREQHDAQLVAQAAQWEADFAKLPADAPLWDWTPFLANRNDIRQGDVLAGIRKLAHRQTEAAIMLDRGDFPLRFLGAMDLDPTPAICDKARALLRRHVQPLLSEAPGARPYADIAEAVEAALAAMQWLVGYGCQCDAEALAWETMAKGYSDTNFDVYELAELRDPKALGAILLQRPDKFSMLTPQAHLRAWLKFVGDKENREAALAGARQLDHRTDDAVEMLNHDEFEAMTVLAYLPALDLEATEPLCNSSLRVLHEKFARVYHPRPDDPRSYDELLSRLFGDWSLTTLKWLAAHGCEADTVLREAEDLVRGYQDSPDRQAMLASLAQLDHQAR